jgi:hypothetical protein
MMNILADINWYYLGWLSGKLLVPFIIALSITKKAWQRDCARRGVIHGERRRRRQAPHSPTLVRVLTVHGAAGAKANSLQ